MDTREWEEEYARVFPDAELELISEDVKDFVRELLEARTREVVEHIIENYGMYGDGTDRCSLESEKSDILKHFGIE